MRSVVACVSDQQLAMQPSGHVADIPYAMTFGRTFGVSEPVSLRSKAGGPSGLMLDIVHTFVRDADRTEPEGPRWRVATITYEYRVLDVQETELLVYHWQPGFVGRGP